MRSFELPVILDDRIDFDEELCSLGGHDGEEEVERDGGGETGADKVDEELDPLHEVVEEAFAFRVHWVDKVVESRFVARDEVDKGLHCALRVDEVR